MARIRHGLAAGLVLLLGVLLPAAPAHAVVYVPISGAGSSWSGPAVYQWASNVKQYGMTVSYADTGSSDGRNRFKSGVVDFAVSEIPYGLTDGGVVDYPPTTKFSYMPIVAGGTSLMYNLKIGNSRVTNLRLSGEVVAKIFTGVITNWSDPAIKADNPRLNLPARKIVPVVRSDGSGTSAQFTMWLSTKYPNLWNDYCRKAGRSTPCGFTSNYPVVPGLGFTAQSGSNGVSGYVKQDGNIGTITYVEYSYAVNLNFPVAKVLNKAGYFIEPTASSVAVALVQAQIKSDLTQKLEGVYDATDKRAYPLSSYSYMIIPVDQVSGSFSLDKGRTLAAFAYYFLCEGQQQAESLGYSPLPVNLVAAGKAQVDRIPGAVPKPIDGRSCNNPTLRPDGKNALAEKAPQPKECDRGGTDMCASGTGGARYNTPLLAAPTGGASPGASASPGAGTGTGGTGTGGTGTGSGTVIDPDTGQPIGTGGGTGTGGDVTATTVDLAAQDRSTRRGMLLLAAATLVAVVLLPPLLARTLRNRRRP
ncbi:phosphate ABC transporter substrate-binding protein PstS [Catellatospora tritici]|uniref:phosphate ABC transporter substrate-binding protein PstS n=1 Tax=Catellatospora tritici TaxID=2851566 RepID=UPI001C2D8B56|nr:phosphate ABC transporter substrate-binding protein PstS [Catellatospora tritici]MBV1855250.1 phosphate ABC transporter substrate-binding protein PstS [Catellatospora tritici]